MKISTGAAVGYAMAQSAMALDWSMINLLPASQPPLRGKKPTGAAHAKRQAKKRKNIRARNKK